MNDIRSTPADARPSAARARLQKYQEIKGLIDAGYSQAEAARSCGVTAKSWEKMKQWVRTRKARNGRAV